MGSFMGTQNEIYIIELNIKLNQEDIECLLNWFLGKKGIQTTDDCIHSWEKRLWEWILYMRIQRMTKMIVQEWACNSENNRACIGDYDNL